MGIPGLTTFISNHSKRFLESYALHDTYLVIDGNSIGCQLYSSCARCNCAFGGDYDKYAQCVSDFFDELLMCNVTPLVLIDGGYENKKLRTVINRTKDKIQTAKDYKPIQYRRKFFPLFIKEVFADVMRDKGVKYAHCIFEADNTIAAIARLLNCPVLSYDSDFYIYGSLYIPFNTWENDLIQNPAGDGYAKLCKIYYVEKLFQAYNGLTQALLPLAAILLGNDYVKQNIFRNFFRHLILPKTERREYNVQQQRIDATLHWLQKHTLNQAIIEILSRLQKEERKRVLRIIETIINSYINASFSVLPILNIPIENCSKRNIRNASKPYKFEGDIYNLTYIGEKLNETEESDDDEADEKEIASTILEMETICNKSVINNLPKWFINEFKMGRYPSYFIDLIIRKLYVCPVQIENYTYASSMMASLKIINVIYGLLISGLNGNKTNMNFMIRGKQTKLERYELEYDDNTLGCKLPTLFNLREMPIIIRRGILDITLGIIGERYMNDIPSRWILYFATMKYWLDQQQEPFRLNYHMYSLLFATLFNIIDNKIGYHRILKNFQQKFSKRLQNIQNARKLEKYQPYYSMDISLSDAIHEVNADDCLIAAAFFISNFEINKKLYQQPKTFNVKVVHAFAEFQNCLRHTMNLNALLEYPYEQTRVADIFNGTLLYNLCNRFRRRNDIEVYINVILQDSPSLLRLFNLLLLKIKSLFDMQLKNKANKHKKQRPKWKRKESTQEEDHEQEQQIVRTPSSETFFYDVNNCFSILGSTKY